MRPFSRSLLVVLFLAVTLAEAVLGQPGGPQPVIVAEVKRELIVAEKTFVGTIEPRRSSIVGSSVDGRVVELAVREGDYVQEGAPLARLRTRTIEIELDAAKAELRLRQATLAELKNGSRPEEIEQARARMEAAKADQVYQESNLRRLLQLRESARSAVTEDTLQQAQAQAEQARQLVLEATAAHELALRGPREERIAQAQAAVDFQQQQVLQLEDRLDKHTITAPFDGYVTERLCEAGQWVKQGDPVVSIIDILVVDVVVDLPEQYVANVRVGTPARVEVDALPDAELPVSTITRIVPLGQRQGRTFPIKVELQNVRDEQQQPVLKAGMLARVAIPLGKPREATVVPKDALVLGGPSPTVMLVVPSRDNPQQLTVAPVPVSTGIASGNQIEVTGEIQPGDRVVVRGNERLRPGMAVEVVRQ